MRCTYQWIDGLGPTILLKFKERQFCLCICHHKKERSIWFFGLEKIFCARCCGIFSGFFIGAILRLIGVSFPLLISLVLIIPLIIDGFTQLFGFRESNNIFRLVSGIIFGIGCACMDIVS